MIQNDFSSFVPFLNILQQTYSFPMCFFSPRKYHPLSAYLFQTESFPLRAQHREDRGPVRDGPATDQRAGVQLGRVRHLHPER